MSAQKIQIEDKKIEIIKNWFEPKSLIDIQVFLAFPNFYYCFIQGFTKISTPFTLMLKTSPISVTELLIDVANNEFGRGNYSENEARILLASFASQNLIKVSYLTFGAKKTFKFLQHAFT